MKFYFVIWTRPCYVVLNRDFSEISYWLSLKNTPFSYWTYSNSQLPPLSTVHDVIGRKWIHFVIIRLEVVRLLIGLITIFTLILVAFSLFTSFNFSNTDCFSSSFFSKISVFTVIFPLFPWLSLTKKHHSFIARIVYIHSLHGEALVYLTISFNYPVNAH